MSDPDALLPDFIRVALTPRSKDDLRRDAEELTRAYARLAHNPDFLLLLREVIMYIIESDRNYTQTVEQISNQLGMDRMQFALAKTQLEAELTGKVNISGQYTAADLGVTIPPNVYTMSTEEKNKLKKELSDVFSSLQGKNPTNDELNALISNGAVRVDTLDTQQRQEWATKTRQIAKEFGFNEETFQEGVRQFDRQMSVNDRNTLMQIVGKAEQVTNPDGSISWQQPGGGTAYGMDYRKYLDAKNALSNQEAQRDALFMAGLGEDLKRDQVTRENLNLTRREVNDMSDDQIQSRYKSVYGLNLTLSEVNELREYGSITNAPIGVSFSGIGEKELITLSNLINGHSMAISQTNQSGSGGGGLAGAIGTIAGSFLGGQGFAKMV